MACEQYINRTILVSNINICLYYLRPDRDSNGHIQPLSLQ